MAGGVMFSFGYEKTTRPAAARVAARLARYVARSANVTPSI